MKPLTHDEAATLADRARAGDKRALEKMVKSVHGLAVSMASKWHRNTGADIEDLVQEALLGAVRGCIGYERGHGAALSTYVVWWVRAHLMDWCNRTRQVRLPAKGHVRKALHRAGRVRTRLVAAGLEPTAERIGAILGVDPDAVAMVLCYVDAGQPAAVDGDWHADLADPQASQEERLIEADLHSRLQRLTAGFDKRDREVVMRRAAGEDLASIGRDLGVCRERVRQLEERAIAVMRRRAEVMP